MSGGAMCEGRSSSADCGRKYRKHHLHNQSGDRESLPAPRSMRRSTAKGSKPEAGEDAVGSSGLLVLARRFTVTIARCGGNHLFECVFVALVLKSFRHPRALR